MVAPNRARFDFLHLLRHDTHIGGVILAFVAEAIEFESIVKPRKRHNEPSNIGSQSQLQVRPTNIPATRTNREVSWEQWETPRDAV
jgi:hypothetical protein